MTREEQIKEAAISFASTPKGEGDGLMVYRRGKEMGFKAGAEWSDSHPQSPWISIDDELPKDGEEVLCACFDQSDYGRKEEWHYDIALMSVGLLICGGTCKYWMRIPQLPNKQN